VTFKVDHGVPALGYALVEEPRPGRFDVATADALGVPPGPDRGRLQSGEAIALATAASSRRSRCSAHRAPAGRC
jgi:ribonuclease Z